MLLLDCQQHYPFSFDRMFLELADKVDIDKTSTRFNRIARLDPLSKSYIPFVATKASVDFVVIISCFNRILLKLVAKIDIDKSSDKFKNWKDWIIYYRVTSP